MELVIRLDLDGAAFEDTLNGIEVARILRDLASELDDSQIGPSPDGETVGDDLADINGNTCGSIRIEE